MGKTTLTSRYKHFYKHQLKHTEPLAMDLPVCVFVDTIEQKWHLRWQCVIVPSRSPDVSMHAADRSRIIGGMGGRRKKKVWESFIGQKSCQLNQ